MADTKKKPDPKKLQALYDMAVKAGIDTDPDIAPGVRQLLDTGMVKPNPNSPTTQDWWVSKQQTQNNPAGNLLRKGANIPDRMIEMAQLADDQKQMIRGYLGRMKAQNPNAGRFEFGGMGGVGTALKTGAEQLLPTGAGLATASLLAPTAALTGGVPVIPLLGGLAAGALAKGGQDRAFEAINPQAYQALRAEQEMNPMARVAGEGLGGLPFGGLGGSLRSTLTSRLLGAGISGGAEAYQGGLDPARVGMAAGLGFIGGGNSSRLGNAINQPLQNRAVAAALQGRYAMPLEAQMSPNFPNRMPTDVLSRIDQTMSPGLYGRLEELGPGQQLNLMRENLTTMPRRTGYSYQEDLDMLAGLGDEPIAKQIQLQRRAASMRGGTTEDWAKSMTREQAAAGATPAKTVPIDAQVLSPYWGGKSNLLGGEFSTIPESSVIPPRSSLFGGQSSPIPPRSPLFDGQSSPYPQQSSLLGGQSSPIPPRSSLLGGQSSVLPQPPLAGPNMPPKIEAFRLPDNPARNPFPEIVDSTWQMPGSPLPLPPPPPSPLGTMKARSGVPDVDSSIDQYARENAKVGARAMRKATTPADVAQSRVETGRALGLDERAAQGVAGISTPGEKAAALKSRLRPVSEAANPRYETRTMEVPGATPIEDAPAPADKTAKISRTKATRPAATSRATAQGTNAAAASQTGQAPSTSRAVEDVQPETPETVVKLDNRQAAIADQAEAEFSNFFANARDTDKRGVLDRVSSALRVHAMNLAAVNHPKAEEFKKFAQNKTWEMEQDFAGFGMLHGDTQKNLAKEALAILGKQLQQPGIKPAKTTQPAAAPVESTKPAPAAAPAGKPEPAAVTEAKAAARAEASKVEEAYATPNEAPAPAAKKKIEQPLGDSDNDWDAELEGRGDNFLRQDETTNAKGIKWARELHDRTRERLDDLDPDTLDRDDWDSDLQALQDALDDAETRDEGPHSGIEGLKEWADQVREIYSNVTRAGEGFKPVEEKPARAGVPPVRRGLTAPTPGVDIVDAAVKAWKNFKQGAPSTAPSGKVQINYRNRPGHIRQQYRPIEEILEEARKSARGQAAKIKAPVIPASQARDNPNFTPIYDAIEKSLREARSLSRISQQALRRKVELANIELAKSHRGEQRHVALSRAFEGKTDRNVFQPIQISQDTIDEALDAINDTRLLSPAEKLRAGQSFLSLVRDGRVPYPSETAVLERALGSQIGNLIRQNQPVGMRILDGTVQAIQASRSLVFGTDPFSAIGNQLAVQSINIFNLPSTARAYAEASRAYLSADWAARAGLGGDYGENYYKAARANLEADKYYSQAADSGVHFLSRPEEGGAQEELYGSRLLENLGNLPLGQSDQARAAAADTFGPLAKNRVVKGLMDVANVGAAKPVRASERAFIVPVNRIRLETYKKHARILEGLGYTPENSPGAYEDIARWVNVSTGYVKLPDIPGLVDLEKAMPFLSTVFAAPRFYASRLALMPVMLASKHIPWQVRASFAKDYMGFLGMAAGAAYTAYTLGADVEWDSHSDRFLRIRVGNHEIDPTGGVASWFVKAIQTKDGYRINSKGKKVDLYWGGDLPSKAKLTDESIGGNLSQFALGKLSPLMSSARGVLTGRGYNAANDFKYEFPVDVLKDLSPLMTREISSYIVDTAAGREPAAENWEEIVTATALAASGLRYQLR